MRLLRYSRRRPFHPNRLVNVIKLLPVKVIFFLSLRYYTAVSGYKGLVSRGLLFLLVRARMPDSPKKGPAPRIVCVCVFERHISPPRVASFLKKEAKFFMNKEASSFFIAS
jgi:hypothetical protein